MHDIAWNTPRERWTIDTGGERGSGRYVVAAQHDDEITLLLLRDELSQISFIHKNYIIKIINKLLTAFYVLM